MRSTAPALCIGLILQLCRPSLSASPHSACDKSPDACGPVILVPGVMGSRLRQHSRVPGALQTTSTHLWLPESHRLLARSAVTSGVLGGYYRAWVRSLNPRGGDRWAIIEPDRANWGVKGVACILKAGRECVAAAKVFWDMVVQLEKAGYRAGNNLFGVPYDWRLPPTENKLCADLATVLHHITNATGHRKALLVGHSLGNLQLLHCLNNVFGHETLSKIKSLVAIAAPLAGAPQVVRVLFSGAEMVSRLIISDTETRDFARQMPAAYMLLPHERVFGNDTVLSLGTGDTKSREDYRGSAAEIAALMRKIEAHTGIETSGMTRTYAESLRWVDSWVAPPVPVVCVIGQGKPTHVSFGYCEGWPRSMREEPCVLRFEDGDTTVPLRSAESVCTEWQRQNRCLSPLSTVDTHRYRLERYRSECVDIQYMHCKSHTMESEGEPRGGDHCTEFHQRILLKKPMIDMIQSLSTNLDALELRFSARAQQAHELSDVIAWMYNSAARSLPPVAAVQSAHAEWERSPLASLPVNPSAKDAPAALLASWKTLKKRGLYEQALRGADTIKSHAAIATGDVKADIQATVEQTGLPAERVQAAVASARATSQSAVSIALRTLRDGLAPLLAAATDARGALDSLVSACNGGAHATSIGQNRTPHKGARRGSVEIEGGPLGDDGSCAVSETQDHVRHPLCRWGDSTGLGLPDGCSAWEDIEIWNLQYAQRDSSGREERQRQREWACGLHEALKEFRAPLEQLIKHLDWCELHWKWLQERLSRLEPLPIKEHVGPEASGKFESVLYSGRDFIDTNTGWR